MPFDKAYDEMVGGPERGYGNDPNDTGGETIDGISRNNNKSWPGWALIDKAPVKKYSELIKISGMKDMIKQFYYDEYWLKLRCDEIDKIAPNTAGELFEASVNCGRKRGVQFLQRALNILNVNETLYSDLLPDGGLGNKTMNALKTCCRSAIGCRLLYNCQNGEQYEFYKSLPKHELYRGWFGRTV